MQKSVYYLSLKKENTLSSTSSQYFFLLQITLLNFYTKFADTSFQSFFSIIIRLASSCQA